MGMGAHSEVTPDRSFRSRVDHRVDGDRHSIARQILADARRLAPPGVADTIHMIPGSDSDTIVCDHRAWHFLEYGTPPHIIRSRGRWPLRDKLGNVFGPIVHHPGTSPQPFLRPAMYRSRTP